MREIELRTSHATLSHSLRGVEQCQTRISTREIQKLHPSLGVGSLRSYNGSCNENVTVKYKPLWLLKRPSTRVTLLKPESAPLGTSVHHHLYISGQENHFFWSSHLQFAWLPPVDGGHLRAQLQAFGGFFPVLGSSSMIKTQSQKREFNNSLFSSILPPSSLQATFVSATKTWAKNYSTPR